MPGGGALEAEQVLVVLRAVDFAPRRFYAAFYGYSTVELEDQVTTLVDVLLAKGVVTRADFEATTE